MLAFFRKYEKTFLLLIFAPALISLGITGVMIQALEGDPGDEVAGYVFDRPVTHRQFQEMKQQVAAGMGGGVPDDYVWRFMAELEAAERAGIQVSDEELRNDIKGKFQYPLAQFRAMKRIQALGIDPNKDQEGRTRWQEIFAQEMQNADWDEATYQEFLKERGTTIPRRYEEQLRRQMKTARYSEAVRDLGTVSVDEVWRKFQDEHHLRVAELIPVPAADFTPDLAVVDSSSKRYVSPDQVRAHYLLHQADFDEPRRVDAEYVAAPLAAVREALAPERLQAWYEANKHEFVARIDSGVPVHKPFEEVKGTVEEKVALEEVDAALEEVLVRAEAARKADQQVDLAAITSQVMQELGAPWLVHGDAGWISREEASEHEHLAGFSAENWIEQVEDTTKVSDPLAGENAWFVLRASGVRAARTPSYEELEARVREEYANGSRAERRQYFAANPQEFRRPDRFDVEYLTATDEALGSREAARKALEGILSEPDVKDTWRLFASKVEGSQRVEKGEVKESGTEQLKDDPVLGEVALEIGFANRGEVSRIAERKDGKGLVVWRMTAKRPAEMPKFSEVQAEIAPKVALERALDRAEAWVDEKLLPELRHKTGEALQQTLTRLGITTTKTPPFSRTTITLEGIPEAGTLVGKAFASGAQVEGPFDEVIRDARGKQLLVMRVAGRQDAPESEFAKQYDHLRRDLVKTARMQLAQRQNTALLLQAKGFPAEHLKYARTVRDGPNGEVSIKLRQIYLPPDRDTIESWLKARASERIEEARKELAAGKSWELVVGVFSEDLHSRDRGGVLAAVKLGDLREVYGPGFEQAVWSLPMVDPSAPIKVAPEPISSTEGLHLVQKIGTEGGLTRFRHLLVKTDAVSRKLPEEVRKQADDVSRRAIEEAAKRLQAGEPFSQVADQVGDDLDVYARGRELEIDWSTPFERAAFDQVLEWSENEDGESDDPLWMPAAVQVGQEWHWFACERDRFSREGGKRDARGDREVYHIQTASQDAMERVRREMKSWLEDQVDDNDGDRPGYPTIRERFMELARSRSTAPSKAKGGAIGLLRLSRDSEADADQVRPYGGEFLRRITEKDDGTPTQAGYRTAPFRGATGWHIVEVVEVTKKPEGDQERTTEVHDELLFGTDWR